MYLCEKKDVKCSYSEWKARVKKGFVDNSESLCGRKLNNEEIDLNVESERNLRKHIQIF